MILAVSWLSIAGDIFNWLMPILAPILSALLIYAAKRALDHFGIKQSQQTDEMIDKYVTIGVNYAQRFAEKKLGGKEVNNEDKLELAITTVLGELEQSGIKNVGRDLIVGRIESALQVGDVLKKGAALA